MWRIVRRVFAGVGFVLAVAGFVVFAGSAVGVWWAKAETNRRTDALAVKANTAVDAADRAVTFVNRVIDQGDNELRAARLATAVAPSEPVNPFLQAIAVQTSRNLAGSVDRANAALATASDAVVVGEAALDLLDQENELPELKSWLGVKPEQLVQTRAGLGTASLELNRVRGVLGLSPDARPTAEQLVTVETALKQARTFTDQMGRVVVNARKKVDETKRAVDLWVLRVAIGITAIGALGAVGQYFMARACWRALWNAPPGFAMTNAPPMPLQ